MNPNCLWLSIRFEIEVLEGDIYRVLFHQTGITVLNDSTHFESFDQFFDSKSPEYRNGLRQSNIGSVLCVTLCGISGAIWWLTLKF